MRLQWTLRNAAALPDLAADWSQLNQRTTQLPILDSRFLVPLVELFGSGNELLAMASSDGSPVAAAIVAPQGLGRWQLFQPSQLPLGPLLIATGLETVEVGRSLMAHLPGVALELDLTQLDPMFNSRSASSSTVESIDYIETAWIDVDRPFADYWEARGKNLRTNMRKARAKLEADGVSTQFEVLTAPSQVAAAIARYAQLELKGWKAGEGTAVDPETPQGQFYIRMLERYCADGDGEIWQLRLGEQVVAMDLCVRSNSSLIILKTAYDPDFRALSPAFLLKQDAFRRLFDDGQTRRIEFYGRRMEWHTRWTENVRVIYHTSLFRWTLVHHLRELARRLRRNRQAARLAPHSDGA